ncbi:MAG: LytR C-terminal domain-containing protein [Candidatus Krumholzibacteriia bacterium]
MKRRRPRPGRAPWYHRISPLTWIVLGMLVAASASLALRTTGRSGSLGRALQVQVLNGSGKPDLARAVSDMLRDRGLDVVSVGNADASDYPETLVLLRRGPMPAAQRVAAELGMGVPLEQRDRTRLVDVTVILGRDLALHASDVAPSFAGVR